MTIAEQLHARQAELRNRMAMGIAKGFETDIQKAEDSDLEKAHQDGDMHPNGKWVWVSSANGGKGDWRTAGGRAHQKHAAAHGGSATKPSGVKTWDKGDSFNQKGSDENKLWNYWYKFQTSGDPMRMGQFVDVLQKKFPNVAEWNQTAPNTGKAIVTAKDSAGKEVASIDLSGDTIDLTKLQTFMDKCYNVKAVAQAKSTTGNGDTAPKKSAIKIDETTIDQTEYNRMLAQAKSVNKDARSMGLSIITSNVNKTKKALEDMIIQRPGAKQSIAKLQSDLTRFISQKKAAEDAINELDGNSNGGKSTQSKTKQSAFVTKTIDKLKDVLKYRRISDEHIEKLADAMSKDEATAKKIVTVKFPSAGTVGPGISYYEDSQSNVINGSDELVCESAKSYVTTSRGSSPYTRTEYTIYRKDRHSGIKKRLSFASSSTGKYGTTAAKAKQECIMEALLMYYKNSVYGS